MPPRTLALVLVLAGFVLLGLATYEYFAPQDTASLTVVETEIDIGDCTAGQEADVVFRLHNTSGQPLWVIGLVPC